MVATDLSLDISPSGRDAVPDSHPWLMGARFDGTLLIGSAILVPIVLALVALDIGGDYLDVAVTALVGGPHLFVTFSAAASNRAFRARHPWVVPSAILIPIVVAWLCITHYQILISLFLGAASVHVLHQCAYICDLYRSRSKIAEGAWSRTIERGVIFTSMYPIALDRISKGDLRMGGAQIVAPGFLLHPVAVRFAWFLFAAFLLAWFVTVVRDLRAGTVNLPKMLLIAVTVTLSFIVPGASDRDHMGLAFQAMNAWHSLQYIALIYALRHTRRSADHGGFSAKLSGLEGGAKYYFGNVAVTVLLFIAIKLYANWNPFGLDGGQNYYLFILSPLLVHYYLDAFFFCDSMLASENRRALAVPAAA
jgi:hypothetical protein